MIKFKSGAIALSFAKQCVRNARHCTPEGWREPTSPTYWLRQAAVYLDQALRLRDREQSC